MTRRSRKVGIKEKKVPNVKLSEYIVSDLKSLNFAARKLTGKILGADMTKLALRSSPRKNVNKPSTTKRDTGPAGKRTNIR